jgi:perosamine synthetase
MRRATNPRSTEPTSTGTPDKVSLLPGPDPQVVPSSRIVDGSARAGILPVSETILDGNERAYLNECLDSNWISSAGPFVEQFENAFANAVGCNFGVACSTGTTALHLALVSLGIGHGDEVIIPAFTMIAVANAVRYTGAQPILVDAETSTWNIDPSQLESRIGPNTKAIIAAHTYGCPADIEPLRTCAREHDLYLIEDAAEAHGASYKGKPVGSLGHVAAFSFYANKIITSGEGGMVTTNDRALAATARKLRGHAFSDARHFWHEMVGFNYRMTNLQAAIGLAQTERLSELVDRRIVNARLYSEALAGIRGLTLPLTPPERKSVHWMYAILVEDNFGCSRDQLRSHLAAHGIETRTFFIPIHLQPVYREQFEGETYPVAENLCQKGLYLPSGPRLSLSNVEYVARQIARASVARIDS